MSIIDKLGKPDVLRYARSGNYEGLKKEIFSGHVSGGKNPNPTTKTDDNGITPLMFAAMENHVDCIELLLNAQADKDTQDKDGKTALHHACIHGKLDSVKVLVAETGTNRSIQDKNGFTPLHEACRHGHLDIVKELLIAYPDAGAKRDLVSDTFGTTALHLASYHGHLKIVEFLVEQLSDITIKNKHGQLASELAKTREIKRFLKPLEKKKLGTPCCCCCRCISCIRCSFTCC